MTPNVKWRDLFYAVEGIFLAWFGWVTYPLRVKGHCKSIQMSYVLYIFLWWDISILMISIQDDNALIHRALKVTKWCESYDVAFTVARTQQKTCGRFWTNVLDKSPHRHHQNTKWRNMFYNLVFILPVDRLYNQCQGALSWWHVVA